MNQEKIDKIKVHDENNIKGFFNEYRWMSNFEVVDVVYDGITYPSTESAYMAAKCPIPEVQERFMNCTPSEARKMGQLVPLREDWEQIKIDVMLEVNRSKYSYPKYKELLIATGDKYLEETNWWKDRFWGVCEGVGENNLGKILMKIRDEIRPPGN